MNITIGQYIPGNSPVHRADPRTKIIITFVFMIAVMLIDDFVGYIFAAAFLIGEIAVSRTNPKLIFKSLKPVIILVLFTVVLNIFFYKGTTEPLFKWHFLEIYTEGILFAIRMTIRIILLVAGTSVLTYTTTSVKLTDGLEMIMSPLTVIRFPAAEIAMMLNIAMRFIPIFVEETEKIIKAQAARGSDFDTGGLKDKIKSFIPVLVPLFVSAFRRAEELTTAMEARCYRGGNKRTRFSKLQFGRVDAIYCVFAVITVALIVVNRFVLPFAELASNVFGV